VRTFLDTNVLACAFGNQLGGAGFHLLAPRKGQLLDLVIHVHSHGYRLQSQTLIERYELGRQSAAFLIATCADTQLKNCGAPLI
jgi:hypothetical protein